LDKLTVSPQTNNHHSQNTQEAGNVSGEMRPVLNSASTASFELGLWLLGLKSYLKTRNHAFSEGNKAKASGKNWFNEARLVRSALLYCTKLTLQLNSPKLAEDIDDENAKKTETQESNYLFSHQYSPEKLARLAAFLRNAAMINENLLSAPEITFQSWLAFNGMFSENLAALDIAQELIGDTETSAANFLPMELTARLHTADIPSETDADLRLVFPYFGKLLRYLSVVEEMLRRDKPLKPALLIFAAIHEQLQEMMRFINNRLLRFRDESAPLFEALDCVVYATSVEIRKIYSHELAEISETRQAPLIYAKIEAAHSLLRDCVQQSLIGLAQTIVPEIDAIEVFPNFKVKLDESLELRQKIWDLKKTVQSVESTPETSDLKAMRGELNQFVETTMRYLMFKDWETFERFVEEIVRTRNKADLTPVLHRFGAYLETLFGQINIRGVLADHPFQGAPNMREVPQQEIAW
jgi:hypothetical protein